MFDNKYPYTDFHELNLDWFLAEFKKVTDQVTTLDATVKQFTDFVTNYFDNLDVQQEINNKLDAMAADGTLSALIQPLFDEYKTDIDAEVDIQNIKIGAIESNINTLDGRINALSTLTDGSTTGDAELIDARTAYTGVVYTNAGTAIRTQSGFLSYETNDIQKEIDSVLTEAQYIDRPIQWTPGGIDANTGLPVDPLSATRCCDLNYYDTKELYSITNNSAYHLDVIFYTYDDQTQTYTYNTRRVVGNGETYLFNHTVLKARFNYNTGLANTNLVSLKMLRSKLLSDVDNFNLNGLKFTGSTTSTSFDLNNVGENTIWFKGNIVAQHDPTNNNTSGFIYTSGVVGGVLQQLYIGSKVSDNGIYLRRRAGGTWTAWERMNPDSNAVGKKEINILFIGNSLTQDGVAYLPYLLKTYFPEIRFRFYMWYIGGADLEEQLDYFTNNTAATISIAENNAAWTSATKTMSYVLSTYKFDVVCVQEYFNYKSSYTASDIDTWNNVKAYIAANYTGGNPLEFISLFHAPLRSNAESVYNLTMLGNEMILQKTIADDIIVPGIAIYKALSTSLDNLGDQGHLSNDGTHAQEGLPCLLQTYTIACWLLRRLGIKKSIYACPMKMTTALFNTLNVPGPNLGSGVIEGTDAENLLAQEIAIEAYKEGLHIVNENLV